MVTVFQPFLLLSREIVLSYNYSLWDPRGGSDNEGMYTREKVKELFQETLIHVLIIILMMGTSGWLKQSLGQESFRDFSEHPHRWLLLPYRIRSIYLEITFLKNSYMFQTWISTSGMPKAAYNAWHLVGVR